MKRILVVDDDSLIATLVVDCLSDKYEVVTSSTIADAQAKIGAQKFDLILLDVALPDGDGFAFCARLRNGAATQQLPIVFLTGKVDVTDRIMGFTLGADDYIQKPFDPDELCVRVAARLRSAAAAVPVNDQLRHGNLRVDTARHQAFVSHDGRETAIDLTPSEFRILLLFVKSQGRVFSREQIISGIRGDNFQLSARTVDSHISNLRKKLGRSSVEIKAVHGAGYRLEARESA